MGRARRRPVDPRTEIIEVPVTPDQLRRLEAYVVCFRPRLDIATLIQNRLVDLLHGPPIAQLTQLARRRAQLARRR